MDLQSTSNRAEARVTQREVTIRLPTRLTIHNAADSWQHIMCVKRSGGTLLFDGSDVGEIDTAGLQLLAKAFLMAELGSGDCRWKSVSNAIELAACRIGITLLLKLPSQSLGNDSDVH